MTADRIAKVEEALAHQSIALDELNEVVREQWREIERLRREITRLEGVIERSVEDASDDPPPPHY